MLQIRLSKAAPAVGTGASTKPAPPGDSVTVACPDHLVIADLPVAKSLGAITCSSSAAIRTVGRRSRRLIGERIHFCPRCDFPIAIYGRLTPCEHAFCLTCARSDATCYLCDERIQKIQSIKIMEGIFICAAPRCLKSFLRQSELGVHIYENHGHLYQSNIKKEEEIEKETRASSTDTQKQEMSTARAPPWSSFSPSFNSQHQDCEETRWNQSNDQPLVNLPIQPKPPTFHSRQQLQSGDPQADNIPPQGYDSNRPNNWTHQPHSFENQIGQGPSPADKPLGIPLQPSLSEYPPLQPPQQPNYSLPVDANQALMPPTVSHPPFPAEGSQPYYGAPYEVPRTEIAQAGAPGQASVLGFTPVPARLASFVGNVPRAWGIGLMGMPFDPSLVLAQGISDSYINQTDSLGRLASFQGDVSQLSGGLVPNHSLIGQLSELQGVSAVNSGDTGTFTQLPQPLSLPGQLPPPPPPPLPLPVSQQPNTVSFSVFGNVNQEGQAYVWQNDKHGFPDAPE